ncbi:MAG: phosphoribosyl-AMP cyclohydrolase, partial [Epsilonproteobacteria bacterium]|nr:phosphoribosyl-AMP cyclohydrolase [Campylobacterota bacterium]
MRKKRLWEVKVQINWEKNPLIPAIVQDAKTNKVLMLAYMNKEAFELTLKSGFAHYFSRSKKRIWKKGESSGHTQEIVDILVDCDGYTILLKVNQKGVACHTGRKSCFFTSIKDNKEVLKREVEVEDKYSIVDILYHTILERKNDNAKKSWTKKLLNNKDLM